MIRRSVRLMSLSLVLCLAVGATSASARWETLAPGLETARFETGKDDGLAAARVTILRVDPTNWEFRLLSVTETGRERGCSVRRWCEEHDLVAAINAGMYHPDRRRHVGYMRSGSHVNQWIVNSYQSVAAFAPLRAGLPPFAIIDLDEAPLDSINARYDCVVQNLRLIKGERQNRWSPANDRRWSEAALGQDARGRMLFIACPTRLPMYELNEILLALPLDLVRAQHLEGRAPAQMHVRLESPGLAEATDAGRRILRDVHGMGGGPVPNVIGIAPRVGP